MRYIGETLITHKEDFYYAEEKSIYTCSCRDGSTDHAGSSGICRFTGAIQSQANSIEPYYYTPMGRHNTCGSVYIKIQTQHFSNKLIKRIAIFLAMVITILSFPFTNIGYAEANFSEKLIVEENGVLHNSN